MAVPEEHVLAGAPQPRRGRADEFLCLLKRGSEARAAPGPVRLEAAFREGERGKPDSWAGQDAAVFPQDAEHFVLGDVGDLAGPEHCGVGGWSQTIRA